MDTNGAMGKIQMKRCQVLQQACEEWKGKQFPEFCIEVEDFLRALSVCRTNASPGDDGLLVAADLHARSKDRRRARDPTAAGDEIAAQRPRRRHRPRQWVAQRPRGAGRAARAASDRCRRHAGRVWRHLSPFHRFKKPV